MKNIKDASSKKRAVVKVTERTFITLAEIFSTIACLGRQYEPKMPKKLQK